MSNPIRISARPWMIVPVCALGLLVAATALRVRRVEFVSLAVGRPAETGAASAAWRPQLIVPGHHNGSFEWLDETRQMFAKGEWRVRHVDYENPPLGHEVYAPSPYRWWLGLIAWCRREILGGPIDQSIEWASLIADPLLLLLSGAGAVLFAARRFGALAAALLSAGLVTLFPFAAEFLPGAPDDQGLAQMCALWSLLPLLAGALGSAGNEAARQSRRWFFAAGAAGGVALWVSVANEVPVLLGIAAGALVAAWVARIESRENPAAPVACLPWRFWALGGAAASLGAYLLEFFPAHMGAWELHVIHPLFGLAWIGGGEVLAVLVAWIEGGRPWGAVRARTVPALGALAAASVPVTMWVTHSLGFLDVDLPSMRLSMLPGGPSAPNLYAWVLESGFTPAVWSTILPLLLLAPAAWMLICRKSAPAQRMALALAVGPVLIALCFAGRQLIRWNDADSALLALAAAIAAAMNAWPRRRIVAWASAAFMAAVLLPGAAQLLTSLAPKSKKELTEAEVFGLVERDLAYWLAKHAGPETEVILAPPDTTTALHYYGGIQGLATFGWENRDGLGSAVRIASASTPEEAQVLMGRHGVTHIIIPHWDPYMDVYAQLGGGRVEGTFIERLHRWILPPWLRPLAYLIPTIAGFEGQSVIVLEVVDEQDDATAASRLAKYFVDMGQLDLAARAGQALVHFPADLGALLARSEVALAEGDTVEFSRDVDTLLGRISGGSDRALPWDQRVDLAVVLAQAHHLDLAGERLRQCLDEADGNKLRSLSVNSLYHVEVLKRVLGFEIADPALREAALDLLPPDLRSHFEK